MPAPPVPLVDLVRHVDDLLEIDRFDDYAPNGLQVEGRPEIARLVTGVSANGALIAAAVAAGADAVLVHHGFFWRNEARTVVGHRAARLGALLGAGVSLLAYHLPLDAHAPLGNNAALLAAVGAGEGTPFGGRPGIGRVAALPSPRPLAGVLDDLTAVLGRAPRTFAGGPDEVGTVAAVSGGGAGYLEEAAALGADLFVTGEPAEPTQGLAAELGVTVAAGGHHATERLGVQRLGAALAERFGLDVRFVDVDNPV